MSEALPSRDASSSGAGDDPLEFAFDPTHSGAPTLRRPKLADAELQAALALGFNDTYLPSSVTGGDRNNSALDRSNSGPGGNSFMNNHSNSNHFNTGQHNQSPLFVDNYNLGLTPQQLEGLLPPLCHPDPNQIPADVLAVLLKSSRFEEIVIPTQRRYTEVTPNINAQVRSPFPEGNSVRGGVSSNVNLANAPQPRLTQQQQPRNFSFSPLAKEFYPIPMQSQPPVMTTQQQSESSDLAFAMSQVNFQDDQESFQSLSEEFEGPDCILSTVTDMITQVSHDPASLSRCTKKTIEVLKKHLNDEDTLGIVVTLLTEQMISNSNFCYSGAKILEMFRKSDVGVNVDKKGIKPLVLSRMQEEFENCLTHVLRGRTFGVLRLFCELYMNFGVLPDNSKLTIFGLAVLELMEKLLEKDSSLDTVRCVCQLLKLIGCDVQKSKNEKMIKYLEAVVKTLNKKREVSKELHPSCISLIEMISKLHSIKWNSEQEEPSPAASTTSSTHSGGNTIYYEMPDSDDDYDGEIMIDDEPEEVQAAYEEFLKMTAKSKK